MEYVCWRINEAADYVSRELKRQRERYANGEYPREVVSWKKSKFTRKDGSEGEFMVADKIIESSKSIAEKTLSRMEDAVKCLREAAVYAERVEWLTSDDDSEQSFCQRLDKQLAKVRETPLVEETEDDGE